MTSLVRVMTSVLRILTRRMILPGFTNGSRQPLAIIVAGGLTLSALAAFVVLSVTGHSTDSVIIGALVAPTITSLLSVGQNAKNHQENTAQLTHIEHNTNNTIETLQSANESLTDKLVTEVARVVAPDPMPGGQRHTDPPKGV